MELGADARLGADSCAQASSSVSSATIQRTFLLHVLDVQAFIQNANRVCKSQWYQAESISRIGPNDRVRAIEPPRDQCVVSGF